jgi:hypothetical protein
LFGVEPKTDDAKKTKPWHPYDRALKLMFVEFLLVIDKTLHEIGIVPADHKLANRMVTHIENTEFQTEKSKIHSDVLLKLDDESYILFEFESEKPDIDDLNKYTKYHFAILEEVNNDKAPIALFVFYTGKVSRKDNEKLEINFIKLDATLLFLSDIDQYARLEELQQKFDVDNPKYDKDADHKIIFIDLLHLIFLPLARPKFDSYIFNSCVNLMGKNIEGLDAKMITRYCEIVSILYYFYLDDYDMSKVKEHPMLESSNKLAYQTVLQEGKEKNIAETIGKMITRGYEDSSILDFYPEAIGIIEKFRKDRNIPNPAQKTG